MRNWGDEKEERSINGVWTHLNMRMEVEERGVAEVSYSNKAHL